MIPRCSFLFENPNMAAVLFVQLALVGRFLCARWLKTGAAIAFLSAVAVVLTGSRGGVVALAVALAVSTVAGRTRRLPRWGMASAGLALVALLVCGGLGARFRSIPHDGSVANRLLIWKSVPRMMAEAPGGWGLGRSGAAFMDWYQPLGRREEYRTLVGSHQTWLVEFGTAGRIVYLFGWLLALTLAFRHARTTGSAHAAAQLSALAVAATFSSVLEVALLWVVPIAATIPLALKPHTWRLPVVGWIGLALGAVLPIVCVTAFCATGEWRFEDSGRVARASADGGTVYRWLVPDEKVLGKRYPRRLRAKAAAISVAASIEKVDPEVTELVVCGAVRRVPRDRFARLQRIVYLSPKFRPLTCDPTFERIVVGEFSPDVPEPPPEGVTVIPGAADYIEKLPELVMLAK